MQPPSPITTKVLVIGAGPVGLFSVFMCGMMRLKCCVLEALPEIGGQCQVLYPEKPIYDIPGFPHIKAQDLIASLSQQIEPFSPQIFLRDQAQTLRKTPEGLWEVITSQGRCFHASAIIICCGGGAFTPKRPPLEGLHYFEEKSIFYSVPHRDFFTGKRVVIAGGGDSAVDWALSLEPVVESLHMIHRRGQFRAQEHSLAQLQELQNKGRIQLHVPFQLHSLKGEEGTLSHVYVQDLSGSIREIPADCLLPFFGMAGDLSSFESWGLELKNGRIPVDPLTGQTKQPGIYAAGDAVDYPHKLKLILTGFAEVAQIAHHIKKSVFPQQAFSFKHSTTQGIPTDLL